MSTRPQPEALREAVAKESLGEVPSYQDAKLNTRFREHVILRQQLDAEIKELEERKDQHSKVIFEELAKTGLRAVQVEEYRPTIVDADRRTIDPTKLLELGVPASLIEKATVVSHSTYLRIYDTAKGTQRGKERRSGVTSIKRK